MVVELKKIGVRKDGKSLYENAGRKIESRMSDIFPTWRKSTPEEDNLGIDGFMIWDNKEVRVQLKVMIHPDGGENPLHGYSTANCTTQRKLNANVDIIVLVLPEVVQWDPRYKLNHSLGIVYVIKRTTCIKNRYFKYNKKGDIYLDKDKRKSLDFGIGKDVLPMEIIEIRRIE